MGYGEYFWIYFCAVVIASLALNWQEVDVSFIILIKYLTILEIIFNLWHN